ncbi:transglutaminase-like putative cysteine protease [Dongia mobilis]|uniref:Transglutaminase-like putative cysteine protease n=1 Tax=Dongia mobilis TaxID=578943 RepID=A0A4R6WQ08_9PROT|nr:transglutaminase family protein [Dongia mobilis]TDQ83341.1 transglutaminase-like putative cysteine protease [Dongia mobilis]
MLIHVRHRTRYHYEQPVKSIIQALRLMPRNHEGQYVRRWQIDLDHDGTLRPGEDAFGNVMHMLSLDGPIQDLCLTVEGEVDMQDTNGILRGTCERFPPQFFLRETPLTRADAAITEFARDLFGRHGGNALKTLHALLATLHLDMAFDTEPTDTSTSAADAFALKRGVCQDLSHVFIAAARVLNIPARYVGGYLMRSDEAIHQEAGHAWAEAHIPGLGWVGFDPANGICPTESHIRVGIGLDYLGAAPIRGARLGGASEKMAVEVTVADSHLDSQNGQDNQIRWQRPPETARQASQQFQA